jgi:hypothetical protein
MPTERFDLAGETALLALAAQDMREAAAAGRSLAAMIEDLEHRGYDSHAGRALQTAIAVCYARPFAETNRLGTLRKKWRPEDPVGRDVHEALCEMRNRVYAHTDPDGGRRVWASFDVSETGEVEGVSVGVAWNPIRDTDLLTVIETCDRQAARFEAAAFTAAAAAAATREERPTSPSP